jgi:hypothetical protein
MQADYYNLVLRYLDRAQADSNESAEWKAEHKPGKSKKDEYKAWKTERINEQAWWMRKVWYMLRY